MKKSYQLGKIDHHAIIFCEQVYTKIIFEAYLYNYFKNSTQLTDYPDHQILQKHH